MEDDTVVRVQIIPVQELAATVRSSAHDRRDVGIILELVKVVGEAVHKWYHLMYEGTPAAGHLDGNK